MNTTRDRVLGVMADVFEIDAANIPVDAAPGTFAKWDSLNHMNLILALEQEFEVRFSDDDVMNVSDIGTIVALLEAGEAASR